MLERNHSATVLVMGGETILFDCGEGTQKRLLEAKVARSAIDRIFISHLHVDHLLGLPALLATYASDKRLRPLELVGPRNLREFVECSMRTMAIYVNYELSIRELDTHFSGRLCTTDAYTVDAQMLDHRVDSFGYRVEETVLAKIDMEKVAAYGLREGALIGKLKREGRLQLADGRTVELADVVATPRSARSFVYCGDTQYCSRTVQLARNASVLLHEATFDASLGNKAGHWGHSTAADAARAAREADVHTLYLTHISGRYGTFDALLNEARAIFPNTYVARELQREIVH